MLLKHAVQLAESTDECPLLDSAVRGTHEAFVCFSTTAGILPHFGLQGAEESEKVPFDFLKGQQLPIASRDMIQSLAKRARHVEEQLGRFWQLKSQGSCGLAL